MLFKIAQLNVARNAPIFPLISFILIYAFNIIELKTIKTTTLFNFIFVYIERSQSWLTRMFSSNRRMILGLTINYIHSAHQFNMLITHSLVHLGQVEHTVLNLPILIPNIIYPSLYHLQLPLHSSMLLQKLKLEVRLLPIQLKL
nr:MAG TPA: hypothetical protein [Caudoviricetes sp.]